MKVKATIDFFDIKEKVDRTVGEEFEVDDDRYKELLKQPYMGKETDFVEKVAAKAPKAKASKPKAAKKPVAKQAEAVESASEPEKGQ